jgi:hypothetical protein
MIYSSYFIENLVNLIHLLIRWLSRIFTFFKYILRLIRLIMNQMIESMSFMEQMALTKLKAYIMVLLCLLRLPPSFMSPWQLHLFGQFIASRSKYLFLDGKKSMVIAPNELGCIHFDLPD